MSRIFITGSSEGLGALAARELLKQGHRVVVHARNETRSVAARKFNPDVEDVLIADLDHREQVLALAETANASGRFDTVIHNAGVYQASPSSLINVNVLAPYLLTTLMLPPSRLIYLSSGLHRGGKPVDPANEDKFTYSDSKLADLILAKVVAARWPGVLSNAVDPGWVPTRMGGAGAPDDLSEGYATQVWLAVSNDAEAKVSGQYFHQETPDRYNPAADDPLVRESLLQFCAAKTGIIFPG